VSTVAWREGGAMCTEHWAALDVETTFESVTDCGSGLVDVSNVFGFGVRIVTVVRLMSSMFMNFFCHASRIRSLRWRPMLSTATKRAPVTFFTSDPSKIPVGRHVFSL
jgi:hypothetical protein